MKQLTYTPQEDKDVMFKAKFVLEPTETVTTEITSKKKIIKRAQGSNIEEYLLAVAEEMWNKCPSCKKSTILWKNVCFQEGFSLEMIKCANCDHTKEFTTWM